MSIEAILKLIQDSRESIDQWGVTTQTLIAVAFVAGIFFILSLREVMTWFLRVHALRDDVKSLRKDIAELKALINQKPLVIEQDFLEEVVPLDKKKEQETPVKRFPLDH